MQIITVTKAALFSEAFTLEMLTELGTKYLGMSVEAITKTAAQQLAKASKTMANITYAKLRTVLATKLGNSPDYNDTFNAGQLQLEFNCLPDLDIGNAGKANKKRKAGKDKDGTGGSTSAVVPRTGAYTVVKAGSACTAENDPGKWEICQHLWTCATFEEYFAKAPAKSTTKTGRLVTASGEMRWAIKRGWIKPNAPANDQQAAA